MIAHARYRVWSNNMSGNRADGTEIEPLVVKPKIAWKMLGCGNTRGYELLAAGELESYKDGRSRKITVASIKAFVARQVAAASSEEPGK
jgi:excisionase family DNA binding protein